jgi:hypothetical protein
MTTERLLHPERAARLVEHHARRPDAPSLGEVADALIAHTWKKTYADCYRAELGRVVDGLVLHGLMRLASDENAPTSVRSIAYLKLDELKDWLEERAGSTADEVYRAHYLFSAEQIELYQENPGAVKLTKPLEAPQGPPI